MKKGVLGLLGLGVVLSILGGVEILGWIGTRPTVALILAEMPAGHLDRGALLLVSGIYFLGYGRGHLHFAGGTALALLSVATVALVRNFAHFTSDFGVSAIGAFGYILLAAAMLALLVPRPRFPAVAAGLAALPMIGSVFFLVVSIGDTVDGTPMTTPIEISPYVAGTLGAAALATLLCAMRALRKGEHHSARFVLMASMASFATMAVTVWLAVTWDNYVNTINNAENRLAAASNFLDSYADRALEGPFMVAERITQMVRFVDGEPQISDADAKDLRAAIAALPQARGVGIADASGRLVFLSSGPANNLNIGDRPYFIAHREGETVFIGRGITLRTSGKAAAFTLSRRLLRPDGSFGGIATVAVEGNHFLPIFTRLGFSDSAVAALIKRDGSVLTISGNRSADGMSWDGMPALAHLWDTGRIAINAVTSGGVLDDGMARIVATRVNERYGIVAVTSFTREDVLGKWYNATLATAAVLALVLGAGGFLAWICHRSIRREEDSRLRLRDLLAFQKVVVDSTPSSIVAFDSERRIVLFNRAAEDLLGYPAAEVVGKLAPEGLFDPKEISGYAEDFGVAPTIGAILEAAAEGEMQEHECTCRRKDGSLVPVMVSASALRDGNGATEGFLAVITGISARLQAERSLRYSEARTRAILDNVIDGIITINAQGIIQSVNPAAERIFGYDAVELHNQNVKILMGEPYKAGHDTYLANYLSTGRAKIIGLGREVEGRRKNGEIFPLDLAVSEVSLSGRPMFIGVIRDLTESKRVEQMKAEFVSTVSHELRTPLTAIRGSLALVNGGVLGKIDDAVLELTVIAEESCERLVRLINDILDVEKIGSGQMKFTIRPLKLDEAVERAVTDTRAFAQQFSVEIEIAERLPEASVSADFDRLVQVVTNLLSNAAKFSHAGHRVTVRETLTAEGNVRIAVEDTGQGIPDAFKPRIFAKFAQADGSDSKAKGGTGLGLNITKSLVERMGGEIWFESELGVGTTFFVEMPLLASTRTAIADDGAHGLRILHLEDDEAIRTMVARRIGTFAEVIGAATVEEGLALADSHSFDVAIVDIGLSDGSGLDLAPRLQTAAGTPTPVVVFSAYDQPPRNLPESVRHFFVKSRVTEMQLAAAVRALCADRVDAAATEHS